MTTQSENTQHIKLPKVEIERVFKVDCANPLCHPLYTKKRAEADKMRADHLKLHEDHERKLQERMRELLATPTLVEVKTGGTVDVKLNCPTCLVGIGEQHLPNCDVAVCLESGAQRALRDHIPADETETHNCGFSLWTGYWPGEKEAAQFGVSLDILKRYGGWSKETMSWQLPENWPQLLQDDMAKRQASVEAEATD